MAVTGRGAGWVVAQFVLMGAIVAAGFAPPDWPARAHDGAVGDRCRTRDRRWLVRGVGGADTGPLFDAFPEADRGRARDPWPVRGRPSSDLCGGLAVFVGFSLLASAAALTLTVALAFLWAGKLRFEERLLVAVYGDYPAYRERVTRRLIPYVY